jgi:Zn-dependent protease with chaperone function
MPPDSNPRPARAAAGPRAVPSRPAPAARGLTGTSAGMFLLVVGIWAFSHILVAPVGLALGRFALGSMWTGLALTSLAWTASAGLMLAGPVEEGVGRLLFHLRRPTRAELSRLSPIWAGVCSRASADPDRYHLRVESSELVNAFALGSRFVAVTRVALALPDDMLEAVMAHELGHHRDLHPLATGLGWWYLLPFRAADWCLRRARRATRATARLFSRLQARAGRVSGGGVDGALGRASVLVIVGALVAAGVVVIVALGVFWLPLWVSVWVSRVLQAGLSRSAEYAADRHAVELGFGAGLTRVLQLFVPAEQGGPKTRGPRALLRTHPPSLARIAAIGDPGGQPGPVR